MQDKVNLNKGFVLYKNSPQAHRISRGFEDYAKHSLGILLKTINLKLCPYGQPLASPILAASLIPKVVQVSKSSLTARSKKTNILLNSVAQKKIQNYFHNTNLMLNNFEKGLQDSEASQNKCSIFSQKKF